MIKQIERRMYLKDGVDRKKNITDQMDRKNVAK